MTPREIQDALNKAGYFINSDNIIGPKTRNAFKQFLDKHGFPISDAGIAKIVQLITEDSTTGLPRKKLLTEEQIIAKYGQPGPTNLTIIPLPYTMTIDWDRTKVTNKVQCHKLIADPLHNALSDLLNHYGIVKLKQLELDIWGGCYNFRKMTNGNRWSRHSWGIAVDLNPQKNTYAMKKEQAQFAKAEYRPLLEIFYKHGFLNLGVEYNYDFMHFEIAQ